MKGEDYKLIIKILTGSKGQKEAYIQPENLVVSLCLYIQFFFALRKDMLRKICTQIVKARLHPRGQYVSLE